MRVITHLTILSISFIISFSACTPVTTKVNSRESIELDQDWYFIQSDAENATAQDIDLTAWRNVRIPHDWAISGGFDPAIDAQETTVLENGRKVKRFMTGRTGALPHIGVGWYRKELKIPLSDEGKKIFIEFDGAMSNAQVFLNGELIGAWPYGYSSFGFDLTDKVLYDRKNILAVRLENKPRASRWYPGAGLYRNVRLIKTSKTYIPRWGTYITTNALDEDRFELRIETRSINESENEDDVTLISEIIDPQGNVIKTLEQHHRFKGEHNFIEITNIDQPMRWSTDHPVLYKVRSVLKYGSNIRDEYTTTFGFRTSRFDAEKGYFLNGKQVPLKGVCLHHDLGPLGAAWNRAAMQFRLQLLKTMGCNAIRTAHNPPAPQLLDLCDEMGFLVIDEAFDEWKYRKMKNGYHTLFDDWAEKDLKAMIQRDRNHPSVILWSIGNEVPEQGREDGAAIAEMLANICKQEDPSRPVTVAVSSPMQAFENGMAATVDVIGYNYHPHMYDTIHKSHPQFAIYASESASTVSSRGEYFFPAEEIIDPDREPHHCSSYDLEHPYWATLPEDEFIAQDQLPFPAGEFVWTGFDYLGEPTPYDIQWPARSSYFGIIDLCGIPKDRYYLYQSRWSDSNVLHLLPHWNWENKEGEQIPVFVYTNFEKVELFLNGKSLGIKTKNDSTLLTQYRLMWHNVVYEPGELKAVALDQNDKPVLEKTIHTAGRPCSIRLTANKKNLTASGKDLSFVTVEIIDQNGRLCPTASHLLQFSVEGEGILRALGNGDPTSLDPYIGNLRKAFGGKCMAIVQSGTESGQITLKAESAGLIGAAINLESMK